MQCTDRTPCPACVWAGINLGWRKGCWADTQHGRWFMVGFEYGRES